MSFAAIIRRWRAVGAIFPHEREAELKDAFLGPTAGYFVEVGANDPKQWSQTFDLEQ